MKQATGKAAFHPYRVIRQEPGLLHLEPAIKPGVTLLLLRLLPLLPLVIGIVLYLINNDSLYLYIIVAVTLLEVAMFAFLKALASIIMDSIGFNLQTIS